MGIPDHLICLLRNLYAGQEATVRTGHGTTNWFQIGKGVRQGCILSPCLFNLYLSIITLNVNGLNAPTKDKDWLNGYKNKTPIYVAYRDPPQNKGHIQTESEGLEKDIPSK